jgi:hypothetical protein
MTQQGDDGLPTIRANSVLNAQLSETFFFPCGPAREYPAFEQPLLPWREHSNRSSKKVVVVVLLFPLSSLYYLVNTSQAVPHWAVVAT